MTTEGKCPVMSDVHRQTAVGATANQHWWPNQLNLKLLQYGSSQTAPLGECFNYAEEFKTVDLTTDRPYKKGRLRPIHQITSLAEPFP